MFAAHKHDAGTGSVLIQSASTLCLTQSPYPQAGTSDSIPDHTKIVVSKPSQEAGPLLPTNDGPE